MTRALYLVDEVEALRKLLDEAKGHVADMILATDYDAGQCGGKYEIAAWRYNRMMRQRKAAAAWLERAGTAEETK